MQASDITFPYYFYPSCPCAGYLDIKTYNLELVRLFEHIKLIQETDCKIALHITIGAAMEELINLKDSNDTNKQWQQLFPQHLRNLVEENTDTKIIHLIISPNESFSDSCYKDPKFISESKNMKWKKNKNRWYSSEKYNMDVYIFHTMMPHVDNRNSIIIEKLSALDFAYMARFKQTDKDVTFTNNFYDEFDKMVKNIIKNNGIVTCFSFAVFNFDTVNSNINNYEMFKEITKIFDKNTENTLLCEWIYKTKNYIMVQYKNKILLSYAHSSYDAKIKFINICDGIIEFS
jgi:hypothetical protein